MIVLAILGTIAAIAWAMLIMVATGWRRGPAHYYGDGLIWTGWGIAALLWFVWALQVTA